MFTSLFAPLIVNIFLQDFFSPSSFHPPPDHSSKGGDYSLHNFMHPTDIHSDRTNEGIASEFPLPEFTLHLNG